MKNLFLVCLTIISGLYCTAQQRGGTAIVVSEINYNSDSTLNSGNWIEFHNVLSSALNVSGWQITDANISNVYTFANNTSIPANGYLVVVDDTLKFKNINPGVTNFVGEMSFSLSNNSDQVNIYDFNGNLVYNMTYYDSFPWPKAADGMGRTLEYNGVGNDPNLFGSWFAGCIGGSPGTAYVPCNDDVVISEINYNSLPQLNQGNWVELHNRTNAAINIGNWELRDQRDSNSYRIPTGTILPADGYFVLTDDTSALKNFHPALTTYAGNFPFNLSNSSDALRLYSAITGKIVFSVVYRDDNGWPIGADGNGYTLELGCDTCNVNIGSSWFDGCIGGSPGKAYDPTCVDGLNETSSLPIDMKVITLSSNEIMVTLNAGGTSLNTLTLTTYDMLGNSVINIGKPSAEQVLVNTSALAKGLYFIRATDGRKSSTVKFIKAE
jgi:hypothetical protein